MKNLRSQVKGNEKDMTASELTKKIAAAYDGKSSAGMWMEILAEAEKSKQAGTLTNEEIDEFYNQFAPLLEESQRKMLASLIQKLKSI